MTLSIAAVVWGGQASVKNTFHMLDARPHPCWRSEQGRNERKGRLEMPIANKVQVPDALILSYREKKKKSKY